MQQKTFTTKKLVFTALMAALTVAGSALRIKVPAIVGTSAFHLGNIMCALSGILLGPWLGGIASGIGSALYDIILDPMYFSESWITLITKAAYGIAAGLVAWGVKGGWNGSYGRAVVATVTGAVTYAALYLSKTCFYSGMLMKGLNLQAALVGTLEKLPATAFNMAVAIVGAPLLAVAISEALKKARISLE